MATGQIYIVSIVMCALFSSDGAVADLANVLDDGGNLIRIDLRNRVNGATKELCMESKESIDKIVFGVASPVGSSSKKVKLGEDYVLDDKTMIFQGKSDEHEGHVWNLDPGRGLNVMAALHLLRHLPVKGRSAPHIVSRSRIFH